MNETLERNHYHH